MLLALLLLVVTPQWTHTPTPPPVVINNSQSQSQQQTQNQNQNLSNVNVNIGAPSVSLGCQSSALALSGATGQYNGVNATTFGASIVFGLGRKPDCSTKPTVVNVYNTIPVPAAQPTAAPVIVTKTIVKYKTKVIYKWHHPTASCTKTRHPGQ
jgi:hypothetical protein